MWEQLLEYFRLHWFQPDYHQFWVGGTIAFLFLLYWIRRHGYYH